MMNKILFTIQLNCFDLDTNAIYHSQSESIDFTGFLDHNLPDDEYQICTENLVDKRYNIQVFVGVSVFVASDQIFSGENQTQITLQCIDTTSCEYRIVQQFTIGSYQLDFLDIDQSIVGTFGQLYFRVYDHVNCHSSAVMTYMLKSTDPIYYVQLTPQKRCTADPLFTNFTTSFNKTLQGVESLVVIQQDTTINVAIDEDYILQIADFGLRCLDQVGAAAQHACRNQLQTFVSANAIQLHAIIRNDIVLNKVGYNRSYLQTFKAMISSFNNIDFEDDCINQVQTIVFEKSIQLMITPGEFQKCGRDYFTNFITYNRVNMTIVATDRRDYSNLVFEEYNIIDDFMYNEYTVLNYHCNETSNISRCETMMPQINDMPRNTSMSLILNFMSNNSINYQIITKVSKYTPIQDNCTVELYSNYICFSFPTNSMTHLATINLQMQNLSLTYDAQFHAEQMRYCFNTTVDFHQIKENNNAIVSIGTENIPVVFVDFMLSGKQNVFAGVVFVICTALGTITLFIRYFIFKKRY